MAFAPLGLVSSRPLSVFAGPVFVSSRRVLLAASGLLWMGTQGVDNLLGRDHFLRHDPLLVVAVEED